MQNMRWSNCCKSHDSENLKLKDNIARACNNTKQILFVFRTNVLNDSGAQQSENICRKYFGKMRRCDSVSEAIIEWYSKTLELSAHLWVNCNPESTQSDWSSCNHSNKQSCFERNRMHQKCHVVYRLNISSRFITDNANKLFTATANTRAASDNSLSPATDKPVTLLTTQEPRLTMASPMPLTLVSGRRAWTFDH